MPQARRRARRVGSLDPRTRTTFAARLQSAGSEHGCRTPRVLAQGPCCRLTVTSTRFEQVIDSTDNNVLSAQPAVLIGLIAHIAGTPLQDSITAAANRLLRLGNDILATTGSQAPVASRATSGLRGPPQVDEDGGGRDRTTRRSVKSLRVQLAPRGPTTSAGSAAGPT